MISLFDYLGHAAGKELGQLVFNYAKIRNASYNSRYVSNAKYTGDVMIYSKEFLDEFFKVHKLFSTSEDYTLINTELMEESFTKSEEKTPVF